MRRPRHNGALRLQLESACRANGCSQSALTVLSTRVDPYRLDTPANHRDATWLAEQLERSFGSKNIHWRGLHYSLVMRKRPVKKPDGTAFENTEEDWNMADGDRVADVIAENDALKAEIIALKKERQTFRDNRPVTKQPGQHEAEAEIAALRIRVSELEQELAPARKEADKARALIAAAEDILDRKARIVPHEVYQTLFHSVHPDRVTDPKAKARYEKAFVFLKEHERALAKKKPPPRPSGLPRTLAEWDAKKWHAREERKAKRAATRAAKAPRKHLPKT